MRIRLLTSSLFILLATFFASAENVYLVNSGNWATPHAYCWSPANATWPGVPMTNTGITTSQGHSIWSYDYGSYDNLIYNNGNGTKTADLSITNRALANAYYHYTKDTPYKPTGLYLVGTVTDEDLKDANKFSTWNGSSPTVVTKSVSLAANTTYTFRVLYYDGATRYYRTNNAYGTMTISNHGWWNMDGNGVGGSLYTNITTTVAGTYTFRYDWAENLITVDWPESQCSGSGLRHFNGVVGEPIDYRVEYAANQITFTVQTTDPTKNLNYLEIHWWYSSPPGQQNVAGTITNGIGTYTLNLASFPAITVGSEIYFRILYGVDGVPGNYMTADGTIDNTNPQALYIRVGDCIGETNPPCMTAASVATNNTGNEVVLNVAATDDSGTPSQFVVTENNSLIAEQVLTATDGQITIGGLESCTEYTFHIVARDRNGNLSSDNETADCRYREVTVTTSAFSSSINLASGKTATASYQEGGNIPSNAIDGNEGTRWGANGSPAAHADWIQVDLGTPQNIQRVRIKWETARPDDYVIECSIDGTVYNPALHPKTAPTADEWTDYPFGHSIPGRYVRVRSLHDATDWRLSIWEMEIFGDGTCYVPDNTPPTMTSATLAGVTGTTATLSVAATDDITNPVWRFEIDGTTYDAVAGQITLTALSPCSNYTKSVYAIDAAGNRSLTAISVNIATGALPASTNLALGRPVTVGNTKEESPTCITNGGYYPSWLSGGTADQWWAYVNLGEMQYIDSLRIYWANAIPTAYGIYGSLDGFDWFLIQSYATSPGIDAYTEYSFPETVTQYIKVQATAVTNPDWGIRIGEIEAYGTGVCYVPIGDPPTMISAEVVEALTTPTTITLAVEGRDDNGDKVTKFIIDGITYIASDDKIVISGLAPCAIYTFDVSCRDAAGIVSTNSITVANAQTADPAAGTNLALGKPVYAGFNEAGFPKIYATDGDNKTRWGARYRPTVDDDWLIIDLQGIYRINRIEVAWETGTAINYEFKSALEATLVECTKRGVNDDQTLQEEHTYDCITSGNFSTFEHRTDQPASAQEARNDKGNVGSDDRAWDIYNYTEPVLARYIKLASGLNATYPSSLWEVRIFGVCDEPTHKPVMQWAEIVSIEEDAAELYVSALDIETSEENMKYEVQVTAGEEGQFQLTTTFQFLPADFAGGLTGHLLIGGLLPDAPYTAYIYAIDEDGNRSENYKTITFTTLSATGCIFAGTQAYNVGASLSGNHSTQIFQKGYRITITGDENSFTVTAYTDDIFWEMTNPYLQILADPAHPIQSGVTERMLAQVTEGGVPVPRTYSYTVNRGDGTISSWTGVIYFFVKFHFANGGICLTQPIHYDLDNGCHPSFVIYHHDDKPTATSRTTYAGGVVSDQILYYRHFNAGIWEDLTLPFDLDSVQVYDTEDHRYYTLTAQYNDGTTHRGQFLLRKQMDLVSGADFVPSWYDGDTPLPVKNQPYAIRFTSSYYADKYILFRGHKQQTIASVFEKGATPVENDQYQVYGNPTMQYQSVGTAYLLPTDHSDETYRRVIDTQVRPFETYVLANATTTGVMSHIAAWRDQPAITTGLEDTEIVMTVQKEIRVYTTSGVCLRIWHNATIQDVIDECRSTIPAGCYIIQATETTIKMVVP